MDVILSHIPVFVKQGSIIPMEEKMDYATQKLDTPMNIKIIPGADGKFDFYEDKGEGYDYENGYYNLITMEWNDSRREFTIGAASHEFVGGIVGRECEIIVGDQKETFRYEGNELKIRFD